MVDTPDGYRKVHRGPIPNSGGIAIYLTMISSVALLYLFGDQTVKSLFDENSRSVWTLLIASTVAFSMGVADDFWNLKPRYKLLFQLIAALVAWYGGFDVPRLTNPLTGATMELGM